ncbi:hypothetical protein GCM10017687_01670 [Streptomyces echinatus]
MRLARQVPLHGHHAVDAYVEEVLGADGRAGTSRQLALEETIAVRSPPARTASRYLSVPSYDLHSAGADLREQQFVLAVAEAVHGAGVRRSSGPPSGRWMPRESRKDRTPSARGRPSTYSS